MYKHAKDEKKRQYKTKSRKDVLALTAFRKKLRKDSTYCQNFKEDIVSWRGVLDNKYIKLLMQMVSVLPLI